MEEGKNKGDMFLLNFVLIYIVIHFDFNIDKI